MIDWTRLTPYKHSQYRTFEEFCYQIAKGLFREQGRFTPIDDSGGGDGVEFYMTLPSGEQWGWQAKFYFPDPRLSVSSRKASIRKSLKVSCQKHSRLTRWFLCTPTKFTPEEQHWFDQQLPKVVPSGMTVELIHWGESDFNHWLSERRFIGKKNFFFGELELSLDWFRIQVEKQMEGIRHRFNPLLHVETSIDAKIHALLGDHIFLSDLAERVTECEGQLAQYEEAIGVLKSDAPRQVEWGGAKTELIANAESLLTLLHSMLRALQRVHSLLVEHRFDEVQGSKWDRDWTGVEQSHNSYQHATETFDVSYVTYTGQEDDRGWVLSEVRRMVFRPFRISSDLVSSMEECRRQVNAIEEVDLHILGGAGVGKTHIASHICHERVHHDLPALLILGTHFSSDQPLETQLLRVLDVPAVYSWNDFLQAITAAAEAYRTRIPIIIDGLNEASFLGAPVNVWQRGLPGLTREIAQARDVTLVTTCRATYEEAIWPNGSPPNTVRAHGFDANAAEDAIDKYFAWYKIKADITGAPLAQFEHPLYLRIFCESQNPDRSDEKHVYVGEHTLFEVFDEFLSRANAAVCKRLGVYRSVPVVQSALRRVAEHLWMQNCRTVPLDALVTLIDNQPLATVKWSDSRTRLILDEGLLVSREWHMYGEVAFFTYDLLGGYLIAQYLIEMAGTEIDLFIQSDIGEQRLFSQTFSELHPLADDIRRCFAALLPTRLGKYLHAMSTNPVARTASIEALFEIPPGAVKAECVQLIANLFAHPENRKPLLDLAKATISHVSHPLNGTFWSTMVKDLELADRDLSWTEYLRENYDELAKELTRFEELCRSTESLSDRGKSRFRLFAEYVMWMLTSTVIGLRNSATQALYWYGRRYPAELWDLVSTSLAINDPYVYERMLAVAYGVAMARQHDFHDPTFSSTILPMYGRNLFDLMFKPGAPHTTTHILARDYARHTIEIALLHKSDLLTEDEKMWLRPPYREGGIRVWGESEDRNEHEYREGNYPFDILNDDPMGQLGSDISKYETTTAEYRRAKAHLWWRLYDLGYTLELFGDTDARIARWNDFRSRSTTDEWAHGYGRKYTRIALHELAGFRDDLGLLRYEWDTPDERTSHVDIDPSFPVEPQDYPLVRADFLGDRNRLLEDWILNGGLPDIDAYLVVDRLGGEYGPWVLLDGYVNQQDVAYNRGLLTFLRGFIVKSAELAQVEVRLRQQDLKARWLPEIPADHYTYAGEIPWCETYPPNDWGTVAFIIGTTTTSSPVERIVVVRNDERLPEAELGEFVRAAEEEVVSGIDFETALQNVLAARGLQLAVEVVEYERIDHEYECFPVLIPLRMNAWGDHITRPIPSQQVGTPTREIADHLELCGQPQTFDLYQNDGRRASVTFRHGDLWKNSQHFTYLRQDLLDEYLGGTDTALIWAIWGEREYVSEDLSTLHDWLGTHTGHKVFQDIRVYRNAAR